MEINGDMSDQFPPVFNQFRVFFEEQQRDLFLSFEKQRTEISDNYTSIVEEKNSMIERNISLIKELNYEILDMRNREDTFESENEKLKAELQKTQKELKESKADLENFENHENEEIEDLEIKQKIATGVIERLKDDVKKLEKKALLSISEVEERYKIEKDDMRKDINCLKEDNSKYKVHLEKLIVENQDEREKTQHLVNEIANLERKNGIDKDEIGTDKINKESSFTIDEEEELSIHHEILMSNFHEITLACDQCDKIFSTTKSLEQHTSTIHESKLLENEVRKSENKNCSEKIYLEQNISELQSQISHQREHFLKQIFKVREIEIYQKYSCNSACKPGCRVFHQKHNWRRSESEILLRKFNEMDVEKHYKCEQCEKIFIHLTNLENHLNSSHSIDKSEDPLENTSDLEFHIQTTHSNSTADVSHPSVTESDCKRPKESYCDIFQNSDDPGPKHLCKICLLSFKTDDELKQHVTKHSSNMRAPSILKNTVFVNI